MSQCSQRYLPLCSTPARMSRDGYAGEFAHIYMPFIGFNFFSGATFTPVGATAPQNDAMFLGGVSKTDTYKKEGGYCEGRP